MTQRLPKAISKQIADAQAAEAKLAEEVRNAPPPPPSIEQVLTAPPPAETPPAAAPAPAPVQPPAPPPPAPDVWQQRYVSLQGMYNKEVPELRQQIRQLRDQIAAMKKEAPPVESKPKVDPKDVEAFGQEWVDMVHRNVERVLQEFAGRVFPQLDALTQRVGKLEQGVQSAADTATFTAEQHFIARLTQLVPDWESMNVDPGFLAWLELKDEVYGRPRQFALNEAANQFDAERCAAIFNAYKRLVAPAPAPATPAPSALETQIAPSPGVGAPPPVQTRKPTFTQKQVTDFYNDVARGKYRGREADVQAIEAEINAAVREGRVAG